MTVTNLEAHAYTLEALRNKKGFICDMDGVIYHGNLLLPGVREFVDFLKRENKKFLFLTNSSERAPKELQQKLERLGLEVDEKHFYTSASEPRLAFLKQQCPGGERLCHRRARSGGRALRRGLYHERGQPRLCGDGRDPAPTALKRSSGRCNWCAPAPS